MQKWGVQGVVTELEESTSSTPPPSSSLGEGQRGLAIDPSPEEDRGYGKVTGERGQGSRSLELSMVLTPHSADGLYISPISNRLNYIWFSQLARDISQPNISSKSIFLPLYSGCDTAQGKLWSGGKTED